MGCCSAASTATKIGIRGVGLVNPEGEKARGNCFWKVERYRGSLRQFRYPCESFINELYSNGLMEQTKQINKGDLAQTLSRELKISLLNARKAVTLLFDSISEGLARKERVMIIGFGTFDVTKRRARRILHPATREEMHLPECNKPIFKPGKELKAAVAKSTESTDEAA